MNMKKNALVALLAAMLVPVALPMAAADHADCHAGPNDAVIMQPTKSEQNNAIEDWLAEGSLSAVQANVLWFRVPEELIGNGVPAFGSYYVEPTVVDGSLATISAVLYQKGASCTPVPGDGGTPPAYDISDTPNKDFYLKVSLTSGTAASFAVRLDRA